MENLEKETKNVISLVEQLIGPDLKFKNFIAILYCKYSLQFSREDLNEISRNLYEDIEEYLEKFEKYVEPEYIKKYLKE